MSMSHMYFELRGPQKQIRMSPSRPLPTPIDAVISREEFLLLRDIYSGSIESKIHVTLYRLLHGAFFGPSIPNITLRLGMLLFAECYLPSDHSTNRVEQNIQRLLGGLQVMKPESIDEKGFFCPHFY